MTLQELYSKWGTWTAVANELKISPAGLTYWRNRGSIPFASQLVIQDKTGDMFRASRNDDLGTKKGGKSE